MRCIVSSNAPWSQTGYGTQTKHIVRAIRDLGYPVAIQAWYGLQGGPITWEGVTVYPCHLDAYGNDASAYYCRKFRADVLITLIDLWVLDPALGRMGATRFCPLFPIDHADPIPSPIVERFEVAHRLLVYSRWAEQQVKACADGKYASKVRYVPHGVDTKTYRGATTEERLAFRRKTWPDWPEDAFVVGMVAANKGWPCRKSFPEAMEAFARLAQRHSDARLYLHSYAGTEFQGPDLMQLAAFHGIADKVRLANPRLLLGGEYDDEQMREKYCAMDVLLSPSQGEGFGLPIVEAQACQTPVIVTDHSAMSELVGGGWRVRPLRLMRSMIGGLFAEADPSGVEHALEECYRTPNRAFLGQAARALAEQYAWPKVASEYWEPVLREIDGSRREVAAEIYQHYEQKARAPATA